MNRAERLTWLARFRQGFAARPGSSPGQPFQPGAITGGLEGPTVEARTPAELDAAVRTPGPVWIIAYPEAGGKRRERLVIDRDNLTLIAPQGLTLTRRGVLITRAMNVCLHGVTVNGASGADAFEVSESRVVALDKCTARRWTGDGAFDVVRGSTDVLLNGCVADGGRKAVLIAADPHPYVFDYRGDLRYRHLGIVDDRQARVTMRDCRIRATSARSPLARHGVVVLEDHWIIGGGKNQLEAREGARVVWLSGGAVDLAGKPVATDRGADATAPGRLYVAPGVDLGGATVRAAAWQPTAGELLGWGVGA